MRSGQLELRRPYRYRKARQGRRDAEDVHRGESSLAIEQEASTEIAEQQIAADSGFVPGVPITWVGENRFDVFGVLPVRLSKSDEASLQIFQQYERYPYCPINGQNDWSSFAISDQLVFHATMFSWGMHFRSRRPMPDRDEEMKILQHKVTAISLINDRLSDPGKAVTDETLAAVAALTNIALVIDAFPEASKHMAGLWTLVEMRGGLSSLTSSVQKHLQRLISWNDLIYSEVFDDILRFPPIEVWDESWAMLKGPARHEDLPGLSRAELRAARVPHHQVLDLLKDLRLLCQAEQVSPLSIARDAERMRRGDMFHRIERKLRVILQGDTAPGNNRWDATVWRAVSLAALLFTHHNLRGNPLRYRHFNVLAMQLYDTLLVMAEDLSELDFAPCLLIWVLSTGSVVTSNLAAVHSSLLSLLAKVCVRHGVSEFEQLQGKLMQFLWTGPVDEARYSRLWQKLGPLLQAR
jgi:hypothetical protein